MRDLCPEVRTALLTACTRAYYYYPEDFDTFPMLSYYDNGNVGEDKSDLLTKVAFQVDVWADTITELKPLADAADTAMRGLGFRRAFSQPVHDPSGIQHQSMRFEGTYNALDGKLYSRS